MTQLTSTTGTTVSEDMTETTTATPDVETPVDEADATDISEFTSETAQTRFSHIEPAAATGRRKQAIARVRIVPGTGTWTINGRSLDEYFPNKVHQQLVNSPFVELQVEDKYDVIARITGGGASGQAGALRLGIARALNNADVDNNRSVLKRAGFLTRDPRVTERKKAGLKKARKAPQYSKR